MEKNDKQIPQSQQLQLIGLVLTVIGSVLSLVGYYEELRSESGGGKGNR
ncbi:MAG: hypothetical protein ACM32O_08275 [Clostridia bacterium]